MKSNKYKSKKKSFLKLKPATLLMFFAMSFMLIGCVGQKKYDNVLDSLAEIKAENKADSIEYLSRIADKDRIIENQLYSLKQQNSLINDKVEKLDSLENVLEAEKKYLTNAKDVINELKKKNWEVEQLNGMLMIELDDNVLFQTGSTDISKEGISLIKDISKVITTGIDDDIKVWIAGHTDNEEYLSGSFDNWDLSAQRALAVVKEMEKNDLEPWKLTALARSMYSPQVPNRTSELKSKNRRTEIYLIPENTKSFNGIEELMSKTE